MQDGATAQTRMQAEPNVTPMIDVLMVLLIIFMVIVPSSRRTIDAQLPTDQPGGEGASLVLEVGPGGWLALNRQPVAEAQLGARLRAVYAGRPDRVITVRGDRRARYREVIAALDSARGAGVKVIGLDTRASVDAAR